MPYSEHSKRICVGCGKKEPRPFHGKPRFACSRECWLKRRRELWREQHPLEDKIKPISCGICSKEFTPSIYTYYKAKYCSKSCKRKAMYKSHKEFLERNPNAAANFRVKTRKNRKWGGNWWKTLERDGFSCRICGHKGDENEIRKHRILVHHLDGQGENGNNNHDLENLWTVCYDCHEGLHGISMLRIGGKWQLGGKIFERLGLAVPDVDVNLG